VSATFLTLTYRRNEASLFCSNATILHVLAISINGYIELYAGYLYCLLLILGGFMNDLNLANKPDTETNANIELTSRENEVFSMLLSGMNPKEIAYSLKVSYYTIDFHRKNLYRKLGIHSRVELFIRYSHKMMQTYAV